MIGGWIELRLFWQVLCNGAGSDTFAADATKAQPKTKERAR